MAKFKQECDDKHSYYSPASDSQSTRARLQKFALISHRSWLLLSKKRKWHFQRNPESISEGSNAITGLNEWCGHEMAWHERFRLTSFSEDEKRSDRHENALMLALLHKSWTIWTDMLRHVVKLKLTAESQYHFAFSVRETHSSRTFAATLRNRLEGFASEGNQSLRNHQNFTRLFWPLSVHCEADRSFEMSQPTFSSYAFHEC
jgi:hypothetical protein